MDCHQKYGIVSVNLDSFCRDTASRVRRFQKRENHRAGTERTGVVRFVRLLQLSAAGEVFLEGTCPLSRCPQTAKFPAPYFWRTEKVGEKSDSFSRAERTRPLRPVSRLLCCDFENVPVERFQRNIKQKYAKNCTKILSELLRHTPSHFLQPPLTFPLISSII